MRSLSKFFLFLARLSFGWLFLYAGITKVLDPSWSAAGYLTGAKTFPELYAWFLLPQNLSWVNLLNKWGLVAIGVSLIFGFLARYASFFGAIMMLLYYFPVLSFPNVEHGIIVDEHVIYALILFAFAAMNIGAHWGIDALFKRTKGVPSKSRAAGRFVPTRPMPVR